MSLSLTRSRLVVLIAAGASLIAVAALLVVPRLTDRSNACAVSSSLVPSCGRWWGSALNAGNSALPAAVTAREDSTGRRLDIVHTYHRWYDTFPTASEISLARDGHVPFLNWEPVDRTGQAMSWAGIASGAHDTEIRALAARLKALDEPVLLSFSHEPEENYQAHGGSASAFVAAFRHVHDLLTAGGATKVSWVWNTMGLADPVWRARYKSLYPGDAYVDWIAWDPYNWGTCRNRTWQSFASTVTPFYQWLQANGFGTKPFMLAEFGSVEQSGVPSGKADWLAQLPAALAAMPNLKALVYFDLPAPPANCNWQITTSSAATAAYGRLSKSKVFEPSAALSP